MVWQTGMPLLHLASADDWANRSASHYQPAQFAAEGFIHCCTSDQLAGVVSRYYVGRADLLLLTIESDLLDAELRWEDSTGSGVDFPHVYGAIVLASVYSVRDFDPSEVGEN